MVPGGRAAGNHREHHAQAARPPADHRNRTLEERLQAARSNNRFADRRIAQLEAKLTEGTALPR
jgi:hypothetical protein